MLKKLLLIQLLLFVSYNVVLAQEQTLSKEQLQQVKAANLTDDQIRQIVADMKRKGLTLDDLDDYAKQSGIPDSEVTAIKNRIAEMGLQKSLGTKNAQKDMYSNRVIDDATAESNLDDNVATGKERDKNNKDKKVFGADLFSNKNLTFEPNLRMPTPANYRLAADDEVIVDVYGYSETTNTLRVSPDGYIRIPNLGPVYVNGLTIEEARIRITKQLATIYSGIKSGNTSVQISLGNIRSIKVLLIGEIQRPGSYTIPSLATVANALYVSGGPNGNGSFRDIQVIRNGRPLVVFDLYDFLLKGDLSNNIVLQDQDIIKVNPYKTRIEISGEIKHPAVFEAKDNETLQNILDYAGGFTDLSYKENIKVFRVNNKEREVVNVPASQIATFQLKPGDQFFIDSILNRFSNRVIITGAVFHPGTYELEKGMSLSDLIKKADGIKEVAALPRGIIRRLQSDFMPAIINFNVGDVINGKQSVMLQKEDSVVIYSKFDLKETYEVKILGEVNKPGSYSYADSMRLEDLVLLGGGLTDGASDKRVEVSRRIRHEGYDPNNKDKAIIKQFDINSDLSANPDAGFILAPFDEVTIRKSPNYSSQANITVSGEVVYAGNYAINTKNERISDVIQRAGGLKPEAYPEGAVLLRKTYVNQSDSALVSSKLGIFYNKLQDSMDVARVRNAMLQRDQFLGIKLDQIIAHPGSKYDLLLEEGDVIQIPKKLQTVQVFGEVYFPKKARFDKGVTFRDYIRSAGGFTSSALRRRCYVVYANGDVKNTRKVFFFNSYPKLMPGAEIYVPTRKEHKGLSGQEAIGLASGLASVALIIVTVLGRIK